ncbi:MAG: bifunctional hydroxymethylpyrimidine kinase/phosphomethylpyrimidine kinase, partial [Myxococcales bacterium]|nr:bifunctional hydroxymethylpyrimidine kinase/phosphomethylpyrimidine kinase [Myxococcales bacterium]
LVTVNVAEAQALTAMTRIRTVAGARDAAMAIRRAGARAVLVKGGHLAGRRATDVLAVGDRAIELSAPRLAIPPVHGTGCTLAALVAGRIALRPREALGDDELVAAVRWAKRTHHAALRRAIAVGAGMRVVVFARRRH